MTPYYSDDYATIYLGDSLEVLPSITADVVVTDPPYGVGVDYADHDDTAEALEALIADVWPLLSRFERVALTPGVSNIHRWPAPTWTLCWLNAASGGRSSWGFTTWQPVLVYGKDPYLAHGKGCRPDSVQMTTGGGALVAELATGHPCPKPIRFAHWVVERCVWDDEVIVDPFMGSGTTLRAAKDLGRKAIGIEKSERYCEIAAKRLAQEVLDFAVTA